MKNLIKKVFLVSISWAFAFVLGMVAMLFAMMTPIETNGGEIANVENNY